MSTTQKAVTLLGAGVQGTRLAYMVKSASEQVHEHDVTDYISGLAAETQSVSSIRARSNLSSLRKESML